MQSDIVFGNGKITGTLKYVTDYTGFSGDVSEQSGNYIAFHCESNFPDAVITIELVGGTVGHPVTLDDDGLAVVRISDKDNQYLRVIATKGDDVVTKVYSLSELTLNAE